MAKEIKFDLKLSNVFVSNLEMLKENFYLTDLLEYYHSKKLHRWLKVREHEDILEEINKIKDTDDEKIAKKLIRIFEISLDDKYIDEILTIHFYDKRSMDFLTKKRDKKELIKNHINEYKKIEENLVKETKLSKIKAYAQILSNDFLNILEISQMDLLNKILENKKNLALIFMLAEEKIREKITWFEDEKIFNKIKSIIGSDFKIKENIPEVKEYKKNTNNIWDDLTDKKILVLFISEGVEIRENENSRTYLNKDLIFNPTYFNGLEYRTISAFSKIIYLEV
ncbi:hypothetical protein [Streptobacillus canis]|uniref:hypothetical protein n=1 Tax=Streptobacillus canis TaxID=2678686 RepID=UPI0012E1FB73|nr:hypothetical protein [Streptobacillus canis]